MTEQIIQGFGLIVALAFVLLSVDDLIWDVTSIVHKIRRGGAGRVPIERLDEVPPKLLAVIVAAWHEDNVLEAVVENMIASLQYPASMYHVFIGVYPNDDATISAVKRLECRFENVHMVVNAHAGPTSKADNINNIIRHIKQFEIERCWRFASVTIHDSEDVVHPYELKLTNYLLDSYPVLQFPVIPLQKMPTLKNVFHDMTVGTYADEFAENHYRVMGSREALSAVVPSAGTGFCISHAILDAVGDGQLCPEDSLTEDYKLSLILAQKGYQTHFVLEKVPRLMDNHTVRWDFVATRSFFPDTYKTAVRQKTRWIYGITMQSAKFSEIFRASSLGISGRYSLYKDLKAKLSNLMVIPGYMVFLYFILSTFVPVPYMYPQHSFAYELCVFLTLMMIFRQVMRAVAITNFYGFRSMAVACLLPPLMPVRLIWGNIINMSATIRAWKLFFLGSGSSRKKKKVAWNKTEHTFLPKEVLDRYTRNIGDVLLEKQYVGVSDLNEALWQSHMEGTRVGEILLRHGGVSEEHLEESAASVRHRVFVRDLSAFDGNLASAFGRERLEKLLAYPLLKAGETYVFAVSARSDIERIPETLGIRRECFRVVYATEARILEALSGSGKAGLAAYGPITETLESGAITWEQAVLALDQRHGAPQILAAMGLAIEKSAVAQPNHLTV